MKIVKISDDWSTENIFCYLDKMNEFAFEQYLNSHPDGTDDDGNKITLDDYNLHFFDHKKPFGEYDLNSFRLKIGEIFNFKNKKFIIFDDEIFMAFPSDDGISFFGKFLFDLEKIKSKKRILNFLKNI